MASVVFSDDLNDFEPVVRPIEEPASRRHRGFTTSAGRGSGAGPKLIPLMKNVHISQPVIDRSLPKTTENFPTPVMGRASMLKTMQMNRSVAQSTTSHLQNEYGVKSEIHTQLRQAMGPGYSNELIESQYGPQRGLPTTSKAVLIPEPEKKVNDQFDDADQEGNPESSPNLDWIDEQCAGLMASSQPKVPAGGQSKKKGKKGRNYHRVLKPLIDEAASSDPSGSGDGPKTKTISHIFEEKPDYRRSYFSKKKDPFVLHSRDDFPAL